MISTETGVYLQFYDDGEHLDKELPPLGPFELLIIRHNRIIGDREQVEHDMMGLGSVERWLEAELELRRALGDEPGGVRRSHMRIRAPRGDIIVRFYDYGGDEPPKVPELGPFYALTIGKREVRADDKLLAIRSTDMSPWTLTDQVRPGIAGINKADFSVFSLSARDPMAKSRAAAAAPPPAPAPAPQMAPPTAAAPPPAATPASAPAAAQNGAPSPMPSTEFTERRKIQREVYVARPLPQPDEQLTPADVNLILRVDKLKQQELAQQLMVERLRREQHIDPAAALRAQAVESLPMRFQPPVKERVAAETAENEVEYEDETFTERLLAFLWAARLFLVTGLVVIALIAAYGYLQTPSSPLAGPKPLAFAAMNERVQADSWSFVVQSVDRLNRLGPTPPAQGSYLIVHLTVMRKADAAPLDTSQFTLVDASGATVFALPATSDLYANTGLVWPTRYPLNSATPAMLVFDVSPNARGLLLLIKPANVEVKITD